MSKIYLIADTHFGHANIIKYEDRPFNTVREMDNYMIEQWNKTVDEDDIVYHLGDFALCSTDRQFAILNQLNGNIVLIRGNHDQQSDHKLINRLGFNLVLDECILENKYFLCHKPDFCVTKKYFNIHGHKHELFYKNSDSQKSDKHFCVSVELINYTPIALEEIKKKFK